MINSIPLFIKKYRVKKTRFKPWILNLVFSGDRVKLQKIFSDTRKSEIYDSYRNQLEELFLVRNPSLRWNPLDAKKKSAAFISQHVQMSPLWQQGRWIYFPWLATLTHILEEKEFYELFTSRNHNLITPAEQFIFKDSLIGIAGLSVGNSAAYCLAAEGFTQFRLADFDELSLSNLNRIRAGISNIGMSKAQLAARQIYELNPYVKIDVMQKGIDEKTLSRFILGPPKLKLVVDEMDDILMKVMLRNTARRLCIPVVSAADNGDGTIVDIERFDREPRRPIYHGTIPHFTTHQIKSMKFAEKINLINQMVGIKYVVSRMKQSLREIGTTLYAWPQLAGAAMASGSAVTYIIKKIILGDDIKSGKYDINFDRIFTPYYDSRINRTARTHKTKKFLKFRYNTSKI